MPSFSSRTRGQEWMDDLAVSGKPLTDALDELRLVNRYLGGYSATLSTFTPWLARRKGRATRILDLGTGIADFPEEIVTWAARREIDLAITAVDANPAAVAYAQETLSRRLAPTLAAKITVTCADALDLPFPDNSFDIALSAMFLHHFPSGQAVDIVRAMARAAGGRVIINDLQRHPLAYFGIAALTRALPASQMVRHDGPLSVLRGFDRQELAEIARAAGLKDFRIRWHWAFRWVLSSMGPGE